MAAKKKPAPSKSKAKAKPAKTAKKVVATPAKKKAAAKPVQVDGQKFAIEVGLGPKPRAGRYEVSIWGKQAGSNELFMVSLRTLSVP